MVWDGKVRGRAGVERRNSEGVVWGEERGWCARKVWCVINVRRDGWYVPSHLMLLYCLAMPVVARCAFVSSA